MSRFHEIDAACIRALGSGVEEVLFRKTAVGDVFGVRLGDGRNVVVKVHQSREAPETLAAILDVQAHHFRSGFPCPEPLAGPLAVGGCHATIESYVAEGNHADTHDPLRRGLMAQALAQHLEIALGCGLPRDLRRGWSAYPPDRLWPVEAHDPRVDLRRAAIDTAWIDAIAAEAKPIATRDATPVLGHHDWSGKHFRFAADAVTAVYDWDSVRVGSEAVIVGNAAFTFTANYDLPDVDPAPSPDEARAFVDEYDKLRATRLTRAEREQIAACGTYLLAYVARCEQSLGDGEAPFTHALRLHGARYLQV